MYFQALSSTPFPLTFSTVEGIVTQNNFLHIYVCVCIYIYMCVCVYIYTYIYICVCVYIYIYIYIYMNRVTSTHTHTLLKITLIVWCNPHSAQQGAMMLGLDWWSNRLSLGFIWNQMNASLRKASNSTACVEGPLWKSGLSGTVFWARVSLCQRRVWSWEMKLSSA